MGSGRRCTRPGHGHYAHGIAPSLERTPLAGSPSLGLNESQSRTWENLVGRRRPFWVHWYEPLQATFPSQLGDVEIEDFLAAVNRAEPGLIRVEADETTYSLHIILRFELEQQLIEGSLDPKDLPEAWSAGMADLLGVEVPDDTHGVLQDIHWSQGGIGYFPTYALGNVISLQIWAAVRDAIPDLDAQMEAGELRRARSLAPRQPVLAGPEVHTEGDDRAADGNAGDRPAAVPRVPPREARRTSCRCLTPSRSHVNGEPRSLEVEDRTLLVHALRDELGLTGAHIGCDTSQCGACTVLLDGRAVKSCTVLALQAEGHEVVTIEGLARNGEMHPIQRAFVEHHGLQCGFCTPGVILTAADLLSRNAVARRRRDTACAARQPLPLHGLPGDRRVHSSCGHSWRRGRVIPAIDSLCASVRSRPRAGASRRAGRERDRGRAVAHSRDEAPSRAARRSSSTSLASSCVGSKSATARSTSARSRPGASCWTRATSTGPLSQPINECAQGIGDLQVRNLGTIGGSVAHAHPASDMPSVLLALEATLHLRSPSGSPRAAVR